MCSISIYTKNSGKFTYMKPRNYEHFNEMIEALQNNEINSLDLSILFDMNSEQIEQLADAIANNTSLTEIYLLWNVMLRYISEKDMETLLISIFLNETITTLHLTNKNKYIYTEFYKFDATSLELINEAMELNYLMYAIKSHLTEINIVDLDIDNEELTEISNVIKYLPYLNKLTIIN